jgi:hypothetical protein
LEEFEKEFEALWEDAEWHDLFSKRLARLIEQVEKTIPKAKR